MKKSLTLARQKAETRPADRARVFLVDDHALLRQGVRTLIDSSADLCCCGEAATAEEARARMADARPDIAIVDISLPGGGGIELIRDLHGGYPGLPILVFSMHDERLYAERSLRAGARGYVMKQDPPERLLEGIRSVWRGELFVSDPIKTNMLSTFLTPARKDARTGVDQLSDRELQEFEAIGRGLTTLQIARETHLSPKTVETYRAHIKRKLGLENGNRLIHTAVRWVESESTKPDPTSGT